MNRHALEKKKVLEKEDNLDEMKQGIESLTQASHKLAEIMYQQASQDQGQPQGDGEPDADSGGSQDDDVVDADFEEVKK